MDAALHDLEGTWEEIVANDMELRGHRVKLTILNGKSAHEAVASHPVLERGNYERIVQGLRQFPLEPSETPDLWEIIAEERAAWRTMEKSE